MAQAMLNPHPMFGGSLGFAIRSRLRWSRGAAKLTNEDKSALFSHLEGAAKTNAESCELHLRQRYNLQTLREQSRCLDYADNLMLLEVFEKLLAAAPRSVTLPGGPIAVTDVGSKNFNYAFALERFFRTYQDATRDVTLTGIEIDGYGLYPNLHSRADYGHAFAAQTQNRSVTYRVEDFTISALPPQDVITMLFPFVTQYALKRWGLPQKYFGPEKILEKAATSLRAGGLLIAMHQTDEEHAIARPIFERAGLVLRTTIPAASNLVRYAEATEDRVAALYGKRP